LAEEVSHPKGQMNIRSVRKSHPIFLSLGAVVFSLTLLELGLRYFRPVWYLDPSPPEPETKTIHRRSPIPGLSFELAPNREVVLRVPPAGDPAGILIKTNSYGMRDDEPQPISAGPVIRIAALGDSYTFGFGVPIEQAYPKVLEKLLNESASKGSPRFNVLNFGTSSYGTRDEALVLKYKALQWNPPVVIVGYVLNDPETDPYQSLRVYFDPPKWWQHSQVLRLIALAKYHWDVRRLGNGNYFQYLHSPNREKWNSVVSGFNDIREMASARGVKVLVVIFPEVIFESWVPTWEQYPYRGIHRQVADLATRNGFEVLDLYDAYSRSGHNPRELVLARWNDHPNSLGHEVAARAIAERLLAEGSYFFGTSHNTPKRSTIDLLR
jgi:lysophospholipase L1-like esterase